MAPVARITQVRERFCGARVAWWVQPERVMKPQPSMQLHLRRGLSELHRAYDFYGGSWHRLRQWWRLSMATTLMTAPGATTELVGDVLGYGSPRSFCLAMAQAGLPSPGKIARAAAQLR